MVTIEVLDDASETSANIMMILICALWKLTYTKSSSMSRFGHAK